MCARRVVKHSVAVVVAQVARTRRGVQHSVAVASSCRVRRSSYRCASSERSNEFDRARRRRRTSSSSSASPAVVVSAASASAFAVPPPPRRCPSPNVLRGRGGAASARRRYLDELAELVRDRPVEVVARECEPLERGRAAVLGGHAPLEASGEGSRPFEPRRRGSVSFLRPRRGGDPDATRRHSPRKRSRRDCVSVRVRETACVSW